MFNTGAPEDAVANVVHKLKGRKKGKKMTTARKKQISKTMKKRWAAKRRAKDAAELNDITNAITDNLVTIDTKPSKKGKIMVDASWLKAAFDRAKAEGTPLDELARYLGCASAQVLRGYIARGQCPRLVLLAYNGYMAEKKLLDRRRMFIEVDTVDVKTIAKMVTSLGGRVHYSEEG